MTEAPAGSLRPGEFVRFLWTQLTSMRTALVLLFALALVAVPGSLVPQRPVNPIRVLDFKEANPELGTWYERLGLFDVYASPWFSAVYLLLMVSLVGCILPRIAVYARGLRTPPPATPRNLGRLPEHVEGVSASPPAAVLAAAQEHLRRRRFRVRAAEEPPGGTLSAERGYLREFGNLLFHLSLVLLLGGLAWGSLFGHKGEVVIVEGQAFSNSLTQYDDFRAGGAFDAATLTPFTLWVDEFTARFELGPVQHGAAREFRAGVRTATSTGPDVPGTLEVNHPITVGDTSVHLVGHGYAPVVTVTDAEGRVAFSGPVVFLPQDGRFTSLGVIKAPDARPDRLAFEGFFLPTAQVDELGPRSIFPDAFNPQLFLNAWSGPPKDETGAPENVYSLDKTGLEQVRRADGEALRFVLSPGEVAELPDGSTISFDTWKRWVKVQVSRTPGLGLTLASVVLAVAGLSLSLFVRPRRLFVRTTPADDGGTLVEVAGLDRVDARTGLDEDVVALASACGAAAAPADPPEPRARPEKDET